MRAITVAKPEEKGGVCILPTFTKNLLTVEGRSAHQRPSSTAKIHAAQEKYTNPNLAEVCGTLLPCRQCVASLESLSADMQRWAATADNQTGFTQMAQSVAPRLARANGLLVFGE